MLRNVTDRLAMVWVYRFFLVVGFIAISILAVMAFQSPVGISSSDKANHYLAFFFLSLCLDGSLSRRRFLVWKLPPLVLYAVSIECVQWFLPYREFSLLDVAADGAGVLTYWVIRQPIRRLFM